MTRLIDDLLDISRVNLGKVELKRKPVSIQSIVAGAVEVIRPAIESAQHELRVKVPEADVMVLADSTRSLRILVVDDNVEAAQSFAKVLQTMGHHASTAFNGADALRIFANESPEVAFLDIGLPDIDGFEVASRIRSKATSEQIVLVALTGWGSEKHRRRSSEVGFDFHLAKPADLAVIRKILSRVAIVPATVANNQTRG